MRYDKILCLVLFLPFFFQVAHAEGYGKSSIYTSNKEFLIVDIKYPLNGNPVKNVNEGDLIYALIDVGFNTANVTNLTVSNFFVSIGTKNATINNVEYNETTSYYKLDFTVPSNAPGSKQDFWVNVTYDDFWETDIEIESVWYFSPTTATTTAATTTVSGGGGGGEGGGEPTTSTAEKRVSNFIVDKDFIKLLTTPGDSEKQWLKVSNTGNNRLRINVTQQNLDRFVLFSGDKVEYFFDLNPNETKNIEIKFSASEDQAPGIFPGKIIISGDGIERTVVVVIEVESKKPLFDVKVEILPEYKEVFPGNNVLAQLTIYNLGNIGRVDVELEYGVKDFDAKTLLNETTTLAVETHVSTVKSLTLPPDMKSGNYVFYSIVRYNGIIGTSTDLFIIKEKIKMNTILILLIVLVLIIVIIVIVIVSKKEKLDLMFLKKLGRSKKRQN